MYGLVLAQTFNVTVLQYVHLLIGDLTASTRVTATTERTAAHMTENASAPLDGPVSTAHNVSH